MELSLQGLRALLLLLFFFVVQWISPPPPAFLLLWNLLRTTPTLAFISVNFNHYTWRLSGISLAFFSSEDA